MRRAKIIATLGPAVSTYESIKAIVEAGVDVARMNLSHGSYDVHEGLYKIVRQVAADLNKPLGIFVDLQGPKIRLGRFADGPVTLTKGATFTITIDDIQGDVNICSTTFKGLPGDVNVGDVLLIDDGKVGLRATAVDDKSVTTVVEVPGVISNNKGINLPGVAVNVPALSEKDEEDLRWGIRLGVDMIALSFVRNASDIVRVHEIMKEEGKFLPVIA
jgi:pyruvate kinase